jgi:dihydrofolate reductase
METEGSLSCSHYVTCWFFYCVELQAKRKDYYIQNYNLPVVLYGYETWSLVLRKERKLKVFENMVLRRKIRQNSDQII